MPRFGKSSRFAKTLDKNQPVSKNFADMGLIQKDIKGASIKKGTRPMERDAFLKGSLTKDGYYYPEEIPTNNAEIGYMEFHHIGKPFPTLKQRASAKGPSHPNALKTFNSSPSNWTKDPRFHKNGDYTSSPGPVYFPQVQVTSQHKKQTSFAYGPDKDGGLAVVQRGPAGKQIVKPRNRDRAWFLSAGVGKGGYMYKTEDPSEIADMGHVLNKDVTNEAIYTKVKPALAGLGTADRFLNSMRDDKAPGPKYSPSYKINSRITACTAHRFGNAYHRKLDRSKAMATGILKRGVMLHQGPGNVNDVGPGHYAPARLFDNVKKHIDYGFGEAQMEWMIKKKKQKEEALMKSKRKSKRRSKKDKPPQSPAATEPSPTSSKD